MKSSPDEILFNKIKVRLSNFEEQPEDDTWAAISANISTTEPRWIKAVEKISLMCVFVLACAVRFVGGTSAGADQRLTVEVNQKHIPKATLRDSSRVFSSGFPFTSPGTPRISLPTPLHKR